MYRKYFLLFLNMTQIFLVSIINAQPNQQPGTSINGRIFNEFDSRPLEFANVVLFNSSDSTQITGAMTNSEGFYELTGLALGNYFLKASFIGFEEKYIGGIDISRRGILKLGDISLKPKAYDIQDVVVSSERAPISYQIDKKVINVSEQLSSASSTAAEVLENIPSITVDIEGNVTLRGSGNFRVLIDGRPSVLESNEALQQIPASAIENVEIITNPSAKYDPEGTAGIINLVMKKNSNKGISGIVNLNGGLNDKYGGELLFDYRNKDFQTNFGIDYNNRFFEMDEDQLTRTFRDDVFSYTGSSGISTRGFQSFGLRGSVSYNIDNYNNLTLGGRYGDRTRQRNASLNYDEWTSSDPTLMSFSSKSHSERSGDFFSLFGLYNHKFSGKGHELNAELTFRESNSDDLADNFLYSSGKITNGIKTTESGPEKDFRAKLDYIFPFSDKGKFEAGYQSEFEVSEENTDLYYFDLDKKKFIIQDLYSNRADYSKNIHAAYTIYSNEINDFGFQLGFRTEYTDRRIETLQEGNVFTIDRWDYFPSAHLSFKPIKNHQVMTSYTRRINRPRSWELEPFETWMDAYNVRRGNPALLPEYIDSYELGYQTFIGKSIISAEAYYRITANKIERLRSAYDRNISLQTAENVGKDYSLGTELFINFDMLHNWNINLMGNIYDYRVEGFINDKDFQRNSFNWNVRFNNIIKLSAGTQLQFNAIYNSPTVSSQGRVEDFFFTNLALRQDLFNKMLTATLQIRDVFGTANREYLYDTRDYFSYNYMQGESPMVMLSLRFNINNYKQERRQGNNNGDGIEMGEGDDM